MVEFMGILFLLYSFSGLPELLPTPPPLAGIMFKNKTIEVIFILKKGYIKGWY